MPHATTRDVPAAPRPGSMPGRARRTVRRRPDGRRRDRRHRDRRRRAAARLRTPLALLIAALLLAACSGPDARDPAPQARLLGLYEFTFDASAGTTAATVRRIDDGLAPQTLGSTPVTGLSVTPLASGARTAGGQVEGAAGRTYIWAEYAVSNATGAALDGVTFLAYASSTDALDGTAFSVVEDANGVALPPRSVRPGGEFQGSGGRPPQWAELLTKAGYRMSVVAYADAEIATLDAQLTSDYGFVNTVLPYGFAATTGVDADSARSIPDGTDTGRLLLGFNAPSLSRVVFRAVAIQDDRVRIASPVIYGYREKSDGFAQFLDLAAGLAAANGGAQVETVVLGEMLQGDRLLPAGVTCDDIDAVELADVRTAGGYPGSAPHYWIGGATANTLVTPVEDANGACVP